MSETVFCQRLQKEAPALERAPYPGEIGQRIKAEISKPAWDEWMQRQTMLINEYRLSPIDPKARKFLEAEMVAFLFEGKDEMPEGYTPPED